MAFAGPPPVIVAQSRVVARFPLVIAGHPLVVAGHPVVVASHPPVVAGHPLVVARPPVVIARPPVFVVSALVKGFRRLGFWGMTKWRCVVEAMGRFASLAGFVGWYPGVWGNQVFVLLYVNVFIEGYTEYCGVNVLFLKR
jgi:hypothetical protein